jgi:carboxylesterase type B
MRLILALALSVGARGQTPDVRDTLNGQVMGILNETNYCREWRGVFFAESTAGANRWQPPVPKASWAPYIVDATNFAAGCSQIHHNPVKRQMHNLRTPICVHFI